MKSKHVITLWNDWLRESEKLLTLLHEQTVAVTMRDVARVERLQPEMEAHTLRIREIDSLALDQAIGLAGQLGCEPNARSLVVALEKSEAAAVQFTVNKVVALAQRIQEVTDKNRKLLENEMTYINGTLTLIAKAAAPTKGPYRGRAVGSKSILVDAAA